MDYRCPTCRTRYSIDAQGARDTLYVKCRVCGFLIDAVANRTHGAPPDATRVARPERRPIVLPMLAALVLLFGVAWALVTAIRWADPGSRPATTE